MTTTDQNRYQPFLQLQHDPVEIISNLANADGWMLDVDGCLVRTSKAGGAGGLAIDGAAQLLDWLRRHERRFVICTNASQRTVSSYAAHLRAIGLDIADDEMMTAATAAAQTIARCHPNARVLIVGDEGLNEAVQSAGLNIAAPDSHDAEVVVVGAADSYSASNLNGACLSVAENGAVLYTSVESAWFHGGVRRSIAVSTAIANAIASVTGMTPVVCGKPSPALGNTLREKLGGADSRLVVVGDATAAEIVLANGMKAFGVLVMSGATGQADLERLPEDQKPYWIAKDVGELITQIQNIMP